MRLYHVVKKEYAETISINGFKDWRITEHDIVDGGPEFADRPIYDDSAVFPDMNPSDYVYFVVEVPDGSLTEYEQPNEGLDYHEYKIPYSEVNDYFEDREPKSIPSDLSMPSELRPD